MVMLQPVVTLEENVMTTDRRLRRSECRRVCHIMLAYIREGGGTVRAAAAREVSLLASNEQFTRRDNAWQSALNTDLVEEIGRGFYKITDSGNLLLDHWNQKFSDVTEIAKQYLKQVSPN